MNERAQDRPFFSKPFGLTLWLTARGYEPLRAEVAVDGTNQLIYVFSPAARDDVGTFYDAKERLNQMGLDARARKAGDINVRQSTAPRHST